ncbi:hypothetical protein [Nocardia thailandica]|uniref:hypothetical protein n=1 Tax=Nocardia thailandica TaxID=257275 RepID=UPI0002DAE771|nr:hypothetical protein [Nocardia thailandica]
MSIDVSASAVPNTTYTLKPGLELHELDMTASGITTDPEPIHVGDEPASEPATVPGTHAFLDAISAIEVEFARDRRAAIARFRSALDLATDADWDVLDFMVECFTLYPREAALTRLRARWSQGDDLERERLLCLVPDTDPGLHSHSDAALAQVLENRARANRTSVADEFAALHAQLDTAEMPRQSIRVWRNPLPRLSAPATRRVDASRLTPEQIRDRAASRGKRRPAEHEPLVVRDYVAEALYVDTEIDDRDRVNRRIAELLDRGVRLTGATTATAGGRRAGAAAAKSAELIDAIWDHEYCGHVAAAHDHDRALAGERVQNPEDSRVWAERRTRLGSRADRRNQYLFQGNGLDDFRTAMTPTHGWRCVVCFIERAEADRRPVHVRDGLLRSDDGLCDHCREDDRPGLPTLPGGFTPTDLTIAYCTYWATHYRAAAVALIDEVRRRAPEWIARGLDQFLRANQDLPGAPRYDADGNFLLDEPAGEPAPARRPARRGGPAVPAGQRRGRCEACTRYVPVHDDGFCTQCRVHLGLYQPSTRANRAAAA